MEFCESKYVAYLESKKPNYSGSDLFFLHKGLLAEANPGDLNLNLAKPRVVDTLELAERVRQIVLFAYNGHYTNGHCDVLDPEGGGFDFPSDSRITLAVTQNLTTEIPLGTFQIDLECAGVKHFFKSDRLFLTQPECKAAEFGRFATNDALINEIEDPLKRNEVKQEILRSLWKLAFVTLEPKDVDNVYLIMAPEVHKFVSQACIVTDLVAVEERDDEETRSYRQQWKNYWKPDAPLQERPKLYRAQRELLSF